MKPDAPEPRSNLLCRTAAPGAQAAEERALVARAQARDEEAFRMLVERHQNHAYGLALRIVRSPDDAEEVAQDAFVRAWKALPSFRGDSKFSTWLHRIVAHRALDRAVVLRKRRDREQELTHAIEELAGADADDPSQRLRLEGLIATLSESQRAVVTLFYYEDRSVDEVADVLGMPGGTVKTHLRRARAALRTAWLDEEQSA